MDQPTLTAAEGPSSDADVRPEELGHGSSDAVDEGGADELRPVPQAIATAAEAVAEAASVVAEKAATGVRTVVQGAEYLAAGARRALDERPGARVRRVRRMAKQPLPVLWEVHADAVRASQRELGMRAIPVDEIRGTAVEGGQRGGDFLPYKALRGTNWRARWQRILRAVNNLSLLPPIDVYKVGDEYWVIDGHNRVAAALYNGQVAIDANIIELRLPGSPRSSEPPAPIADYVAEDSRDVRAAGEGRFTRTSARTEHHHREDHGEQDTDATDDRRSTDEEAPGE